MAPLSSDDLLVLPEDRPTRPALVATGENPVPQPAPATATAATPAPTLELRTDAPAWRPWQRVLFRYLTCHAALWWLPAPFASFFATLRDGLAWLGHHAELAWLKAGPAEWAA